MVGKGYGRRQRRGAKRGTGEALPQKGKDGLRCVGVKSEIQHGKFAVFPSAVVVNVLRTDEYQISCLQRKELLADEMEGTPLHDQKDLIIIVIVWTEIFCFAGNIAIGASDFCIHKSIRSKKLWLQKDPFFQKNQNTVKFYHNKGRKSSAFVLK